MHFTIGCNEPLVDVATTDSKRVVPYPGVSSGPITVNSLPVLTDSLRSLVERGPMLEILLKD